MKSISMLSLVAFALSTASVTSKAEEKVRWTGMIRDSETAHTTFHDHDLELVRLEDGVEFKIVDSPELKELHCSTEKNYVVELEGEITPKFLFWGGNLKVNSFKVVQGSETASHPHHRPEDTWPSLRSRTSSLDRG